MGYESICTTFGRSLRLLHGKRQEDLGSRTQSLTSTEERGRLRLFSVRPECFFKGQTSQTLADWQPLAGRLRIGLLILLRDHISASESSEDLFDIYAFYHATCSMPDAAAHATRR